MTSKLIPSDPASVMVIRQITPNITTCSAPFLRFGRLKVGGRGTIGIRLGTLSVVVLICICSTPPIRCPRSLLSHCSHTGSPLYCRIHGESCRIYCFLGLRASYLHHRMGQSLSIGEAARCRRFAGKTRKGSGHCRHQVPICMDAEE